MNSDLQYLGRLISMIDKDGDDQSRKRLWSLICNLAKNEMGNITEKETTILINEIHELNMEQYIRVQAKHFYDEFPFVEIKEQLVADFIEMEHCRRRDDFYRFCVAAYQQLENITNYLFSKFDYWTATTNQIKAELPQLISPTEKNWNFSLCKQLVYLSKNKDTDTVAINNFLINGLRDLKFNNKFKIVLYWGYFKDEKINYLLWNTSYELGDKLYAARNKVHRGTVDSEKQAVKLSTIEKNKYKYYLLFSGYLADFIHKITSNYRAKEHPVVTH
jgi:hypothetical protein